MHKNFIDMNFLGGGGGGKERAENLVETTLRSFHFNKTSISLLLSEISSHGPKDFDFPFSFVTGHSNESKTKKRKIKIVSNFLEQNQI